MATEAWEPVYELANPARPAKTVGAFVVNGNLDRWFVQTFLPVAETPLSGWLMKDAGYVKPPPPTTGAPTPVTGRGWPR